MIGNITIVGAGNRGKSASADLTFQCKCVAYRIMPTAAMTHVCTELEALYPGLVRTASVLEAGLNNANLIIHQSLLPRRHRHGIGHVMLPWQAA